MYIQYIGIYIQYIYVYIQYNRSQYNGVCSMLTKMLLHQCHLYMYILQIHLASATFFLLSTSIVNISRFDCTSMPFSSSSSPQKRIKKGEEEKLISDIEKYGGRLLECSAGK